MSKTTKYPEIRTQIKERAAHSRAIHEQIREATGLDRHRLWNEKRWYGAETRLLLLAYAFLRGMPYHAVERKCRNNPCDLHYAIQRRLKALGHEMERESIKSWLKAEVLEVAA